MIAASPARVWRAWMEPGELVQWLPPGGMSGRIEALEPRPGGVLRMVLTHDDATGAPGKTDAASDRIEGSFAALDPPHALTLEIRFVSGDPRFCGVMRMDWRFADAPGGTRVTVSARDVPEGIAPADHEAGLNQSLEQLSRWIAANPEASGTRMS